MTPFRSLFALSFLATTAYISFNSLAKAEGESTMTTDFTEIGGNNDHKVRQRVFFSYSPGHGLTDIDFHSITPINWDTMKTSDPNTIASLEVAPQTTPAQLEMVKKEISEVGGYKIIEVTHSKR